jgi:ABC-2 type transport system ATP-binding protein
MPEPALAPPILVRDLHKRFGHSTALDGLDLSVHAGEVHGFLGPNGAGKSTTIRVLLGLVKADSGTASVFGRDPWRRPATTNADIAYVPGDVALWPNLTGGETIDLLLSLRSGADAGERERLISDFDLDPRKKARSYSKGNRQKVALVAAFARSAALYVLDEPTSGLDPVMEAVFRAEIRRVRSAGATVLLSSHMLAEVEQLCDRVTILREGRTVQATTLTDLVREASTTFSVTGVRLEAIAGIEGVSVIESSPAALRFEARGEALPAVLTALDREHAMSLTATPPTLETLFLSHYEKSDR